MNAKEYVKEVKAEMSHVTFPTKRQGVLYTILVIIFSLGVASFLGLFDFLFKTGVQKLLNF